MRPQSDVCANTPEINDLQGVLMGTLSQHTQSGPHRGRWTYPEIVPQSGFSSPAEDRPSRPSLSS